MKVLQKKVDETSGSFTLYTILPTLFLVMCMQKMQAQELQRNAFSFLNVSPAARVSGLGGVNVSLKDRDPNMFLSNPSAVSDSLSGFASLNYRFHVGDIGHAAFSFLPHIGRIGTIGIAVNHFSYGTLQGYDPSGLPTSDFNVSETAIVISKSHQVNNFRLGLSLKGAFSSLAGYRASGLMADIGGMFVHPKQNLQIALVLKNAGFVLSDYSGGSESALPIDLQIGATLQPEHMPFRFSITAYRLIQSKAVDYVQNQVASPSAVKKIFRHLNFGGEILLHRNVNILLGYNNGIHQELRLENAGGSAGWSFGFSARVKSVEFVFSRSTYVVGSAGYAFTLSKDVSQFWKKGK